MEIKARQMDSIRPIVKDSHDGSDLEGIKEDNQISKRLGIIAIAVGLTIGMATMYSRLNFHGDFSKIENYLQQLALEKAANKKE